jgi:hypothetical protein
MTVAAKRQIFISYARSDDGLPIIGRLLGHAHDLYAGVAGQAGWAAEVGKKSGESSLKGITYPNPDGGPAGLPPGACGAGFECGARYARPQRGALTATGTEVAIRLVQLKRSLVGPGVPGRQGMAGVADVPEGEATRLPRPRGAAAKQTP